MFGGSIFFLGCFGFIWGNVFGFNIFMFYLFVWFPDAFVILDVFVLFWDVGFEFLAV